MCILYLTLYINIWYNIYVKINDMEAVMYYKVYHNKINLDNGDYIYQNFIEFYFNDNDKFENCDFSQFINACTPYQWEDIERIIKREINETHYYKTYAPIGDDNYTIEFNHNRHASLW